MTVNGIRTSVIGAAWVSALVLCQPAAAQGVTAQGWPDAAPVTAAAIVKPAAKPTAGASRPAAKVAPAAPKPAAAPATPTPATATPDVATDLTVPTGTTIAASVPEMLQQQWLILKRLTEELDRHRAVIAEQQQQIKALEAAKAEATAAPAAAPPAKTPPPPAAPPITVETGGIKLKMSGLFQGWYTATSGTVVDTFRLRRTELKFSGDMSPRVKWALMVDAAKALSLSTTSATVGGQQVLTGSSIGQGGRVLQDAFASLVFTPALTVDVGQQKLPLSMEGMQSSGRLDTIERALFMSDKARGGGYGDIRDLGLMVRGRIASGQVEYFAGVFNGLGESQNDQDRNDQKDAAARIVVRPAFAKGFQFGGSFARDGFAALGATGRERHGVELVYGRPSFGLKSEWMSGRDGRVTRRGGYLQASRRLHRSVQALFRVDRWDPDTRTDSTAETAAELDWLGGVTYTIANSGAWLQFNFVRKTFAEVIPARNVFIANIQSTW